MATSPAHVPSAELAAWARGVSLARNVDGIIVTVPHKFASFELCSAHSERAAFLHTVNVMRRLPDGKVKAGRTQAELAAPGAVDGVVAAYRQIVASTADDIAAGVETLRRGTAK